MAKVRAALVSRDSLADVARSIDLGAFIELAVAEENTGGRHKDSIVADALEAIIGAVYLDGGLDSVSVLINTLWGDRIAERAKRPGVKDYKTRLQEVLAKEGLRPEYETEGTGPDHAQMFTASVTTGGKKLGEGSGRSKKEAEQGAARQALDQLSQDSR